MDRTLLPQALIKFLAGIILIGLMVFLPAGSFTYWQGWLLMGVLFVPMSCSERFVETYTQDAELVVDEGENHMITRRLKTVVSHAVSFFASIYRTFQVNVYENFKQAFALYRFGGDIERM